MLNAHRSLPAGTCLLSELTQKLRECGTLTDLNVVLPTQRLNLYLSRELAVLNGGSTLLPRLWTWDRFVEYLIDEHLSTNKVMVSSQCELIMEHILDKRSSQSSRALHTNRRHAHELVHLAAEVARSGASADAKDRLIKYLENDWRRAGEAFSLLSERIDDVFSAIDDYRETLAQLKWTTSEQLRAHAIERWLNDSRELQQLSLPPGKIVIAGLTSLPPLESKLLAILAKLQNIEVWLDEPPTSSQAAPLAELRKQVSLEPSVSASDSWASGVKIITGCADITQEVAYVLGRVLHLIDAGTPPHEIAIIVPDEVKYAPAFAAMVDAMGVSLNMPLASSWSTSQIGRWLRLVTGLGQDNEIHGFGQYILNPFSKALFKAPESFDEISFQFELKNLPEFGRNGRELCDFFKRKFDDETATFIERALQWYFDSGFNDITDAKDHFIHTLDTLKSSTTSKASPRETKAWEMAQEAAEQVAQLNEVCQYSGKQWREFLANVYRTASQESLRDTGEPLSGLQIIGLTEARYIPFTAVFIVGCVEGSFPHGLPRDSLIDNQMRRVMGLPGWAELEALEDTTFHLLTSRLPHVELTYPHSDADKPLTRSRWIEILATKIKPRDLDSGDRTTSILCNKEFPPKERFEPSSTASIEGLVSDSHTLTSTTSASRLRNLLWCPYRYLLQARKVEAIELPEDRQNLQTGDWLHKVLETFFKHDDISGLGSEHQWRNQPSTPSEFAAWAHDRLDAIAQLIIPKSLARTAQFQHMTGRGWATIANFWQELLLQGWNPNLVSTEVDLGKKSSVSFDVTNRQINVHGTIDAVHGSHEHGPILLDYKTSKTPASKRIASGLEPQLALYALSLSKKGAPILAGTSNYDLERTAVGYFNLSEGKPSFVAMGGSSKNDLITAGLLSRRSKPLDINDTISAVMSRWTDRLKTITETHRFQADPSDCAMCSYAGICRKDDPRYRDRMAQQKVALPDSAAEIEDDDESVTEGGAPE